MDRMKEKAEEENMFTDAIDSDFQKTGEITVFHAVFGDISNTASRRNILLIKAKKTSP
jgi:hypothetical protein